MRKYGFTLIELLFVIIIMGIIGTFGAEFLSKAYDGFAYSKINNDLQAKSESAVNIIASRLQYRIKDSIIVRDSNITNLAANYQALANSTYDENATVLEWIGVDIDGYRGTSNSNWSGVIDLDLSSKNSLRSPETNATAINNFIQALSNSSGSDLNSSALYFVGSDSDVNQFGWDGNAISDHNSTIHPINYNSSGTNINFTTPAGFAVDFNNTNVYEYYQLAWTAYAVDLNTTSGNLTLHYDYQPWNGDNYLLKQDGVTPTKSTLIMQNVSTFRFKSAGAIVKIQVCVKTDPALNFMEDYSLCKEKTIY